MSTYSPRDNRTTLPHLQAWRLHKRMTLDKLCERTGVAKSTLVRLEHGSRANSITVNRLAAGLGITPQELLGKPENDTPQEMPTTAADESRMRELFQSVLVEFAEQLAKARKVRPDASTEDLVRDMLGDTWWRN